MGAAETMNGTRHRPASQGTFHKTFYVLQGMELLGGAINLMLMGMNIRDGLRMNGRFHAMASISPR